MIQKILLRLRHFYQQYPASYSLLELFLFLGLYFFYMWVSTFWFWGIYRLNIRVPDTIERIFFSLWRVSPRLILPSIILGLFLLVVTLFVRKDPLRELGIRLDNVKASGRECFIVFLIGASLIVVFFLVHLKDFTPQAIRHYCWLVAYPLWGVVQQFLLQSFTFVRLLQILRNRNGTIVASAVIFTFLHAPKISLMLITFIGTLCLCALFSRHRNIFTLGILHGVLAAMAFVLLVPGVIGGFAAGPLRNNAAFLAHLRHDNGTIVAKPSTIISIPIEVENKSTAVWNSQEEEHPVHISYHLLDADGNMITHDNVRTSFPHPLEPGEALKVDLAVTVPKALGRYQLEIDVVKERVEWFKNKGSLAIRVPLIVSEKGKNP